MAVSGDSALVGANNADAAGGNSGAAYAFRREGATWIEKAKLLHADVGGGAEFGFPVALEGGDAVIGSGRDGDAAPSAGSA